MAKRLHQLLVQLPKLQARSLRRQNKSHQGRHDQLRRYPQSQDLPPRQHSLWLSLRLLELAAPRHRVERKPRLPHHSRHELTLVRRDLYHDFRQSKMPTASTFPR